MIPEAHGMTNLPWQSLYMIDFGDCRLGIEDAKRYPDLPPFSHIMAFPNIDEAEKVDDNRTQP